MSLTINGLGTNSLVSLYQQMGVLGTGNQTGTNILNVLQGGTIQQQNPFSMLMGGTAGNSNMMAALAGMNPGNSALMSFMLNQNAGATSAPAMPTPSGASNVMQTQSPAVAGTPPPQNAASAALTKLVDTMFNNASNGTGKMDKTQFANFISQMDPNGTSGVNADKLFGQLDPNNTGFVTQAQFDAAFNGTAGATGADATAISSAMKNLMGAMFQNADANGTGQLDINQFTNLVNQMDPNGTSGVNATDLFNQMDKFQIGMVTPMSFNAAVQGMVAPTVVSGGVRNLMDAAFNATDATGSGKLNQAQFNTMMQQLDPTGASGVNANDLFKQMDPQNTGSVTKGAFDAAIKGIFDPAGGANPTASQTFAKVLATSFNAASNGFGVMGAGQFSNFVNQIDPAGASGVNANDLFAALDPQNTGMVTQDQFNAPMNAALPQPQAAATPPSTTALPGINPAQQAAGAATQTGNTNTVSNIFSQASVQLSIMQYRSTMDILNNALVGGSANNGGINSLLNVII